MQNNPVRGPLKKVGTTNKRFFVIICISIRYKFNLFAVRRAAPVICDTGFFTTSPEICSPKMSLRAYIGVTGAYIEGHRSFADAQDDREDAQDDREDAQDDRKDAQDDREESAEEVFKDDGCIRTGIPVFHYDRSIDMDSRCRTGALGHRPAACHDHSPFRHDHLPGFIGPDIFTFDSIVDSGG